MHTNVRVRIYASELTRMSRVTKAWTGPSSIWPLCSTGHGQCFRKAEGSSFERPGAVRSKGHGQYVQSRFENPWANRIAQASHAKTHQMLPCTSHTRICTFACSRTCTFACCCCCLLLLLLPRASPPSAGNRANQTCAKVKTTKRNMHKGFFPREQNH